MLIIQLKQLAITYSCNTEVMPNLSYIQDFGDDN